LRLSFRGEVWAPKTFNSSEGNTGIHLLAFALLLFKLLAMSIVIENPTAESIYQALQDVAPEELSRLREMLLEGPRQESSEEEEEEWRRISAHSAARFYRAS